MRQLRSPSTKTVLVTAGPTRAYLDDVRYLSNLSSGRLGFAICRELCRKGYEVVAIVGPCDVAFETLKLKRLLRVETNREMAIAVNEAARRFKTTWGVFSAAVLDFEPIRRKGKVSSSRSEWVVKLRPAPKIIDEVSARFPALKRVGFKLEVAKRSRVEAEAFAERYRKRKGLSALVYNQLDGVGATRHAALFIDSNGKVRALKTKVAIAKAIVRYIEAFGDSLS